MFKKILLAKDVVYLSGDESTASATRSVWRIASPWLVHDHILLTGDGARVED